MKQNAFSSVTRIHAWGHKLPLYNRLTTQYKGQLQSYKIQFETATPNVIIGKYFKCWIPHVICFSLEGLLKFTKSVQRLGYALKGQGDRVHFPVGARGFLLRHRVQIGSGAHQPTYPMGTRDSFNGGNAGGISCRPPASI